MIAALLVTVVVIVTVTLAAVLVVGIVVSDAINDLRDAIETRLWWPGDEGSS